MCFFRFAYIRLERMERIVYAYLYISVCVCARYINHSEDCGTRCLVVYRIYNIANPVKFLRDIAQQNSCMRGFARNSRRYLVTRNPDYKICVCVCVCGCANMSIIFLSGEYTYVRRHETYLETHCKLSNEL